MNVQSDEAATSSSLINSHQFIDEQKILLQNRVNELESALLAAAEATHKSEQLFSELNKKVK